MRRLVLPLLALLLESCAMSHGPDQMGRYESCDAFAASGGYPVAWGADYGGNPNFLYLPGQDPIRLSNNFLQRHLEITDALRDYCERHAHY